MLPPNTGNANTGELTFNKTDLEEIQCQPGSQFDTDGGGGVAGDVRWLLH